MRRILIECARQKQSLKRGGDLRRRDLLEQQRIAEAPDDRLLALDEALQHFAREQPRMAELVQLHFFAGLTLQQAAETLGVSLRTANRDWTFARAWLRRAMDREE